MEFEVELYRKDEATPRICKFEATCPTEAHYRGTEFATHFQADHFTVGPPVDRDDSGVILCVGTSRKDYEQNKFQRAGKPRR
jgi:hypothetical protein